MSDTPPAASASSAPPTAADAAAAQATLNAYNQAQQAEANASTLAALTPVDFVAGPNWAANTAALKANWTTVMTANPSIGQAMQNAVIVLEHLNLMFTSAFTAAGGVAPAT